MDKWQELDEFLDTHEAKKQQREQQNVQMKVERDKAAKDFFDFKVVPLFEKAKTTLEARGRKVMVNSNGFSSAGIEIYHEDKREFRYAVDIKWSGNRVFAEPRYEGGVGFFRSGVQNYNLDDLTQEEISDHFLSAYKSHIAR